MQSTIDKENVYERPTPHKRFVVRFICFVVLVIVAPGVLWLWLPPQMDRKPKDQVESLLSTTASKPPQNLTDPTMDSLGDDPTPAFTLSRTMTRIDSGALQLARSITLSAEHLVMKNNFIKSSLRSVHRRKNQSMASVKKEQASERSKISGDEFENALRIFLQAVNNNNLIEAGERLKVVQALTVPGSLSRMRAEAWYALKTDQRDSARKIYTEILDRVEGDEEASINLASIEVREDRHAHARQLLAAALLRNPESELLRNSLNLFRATPSNCASVLGDIGCPIR